MPAVKTIGPMAFEQMHTDSNVQFLADSSSWDILLFYIILPIYAKWLSVIRAKLQPSKDSNSEINYSSGASSSGEYIWPSGVQTLLFKQLLIVYFIELLPSG